MQLVFDVPVRARRLHQPFGIRLKTADKVARFCLNLSA
jgi:hypothetical protein